MFNFKSEYIQINKDDRKNIMDSITIVGDNVIALYTALILNQRYKEHKISVIKDENDDSGTAPVHHPFKEVAGLCGISLVPVMTAGRCTFRWGTKFEMDNKNSYLDFRVQGPYKHEFAQYPFIYGKLISEDFSFLKIMHPDLYTSHVNKGIHPDQFHLDLKGVSEYLQTLCVEKDIKIITDTITKVEVKSDRIVSITGKKKYTSDFYIDATGLKRTLIKHLKPEYISFSDSLPMNEMITFSGGDSTAYNTFTTVKYFKGGWLQSFPLWKSTEYRFIYNNNKISFNKAKEIVTKAVKQKLKFGKKVSIESGQLRTPWINNCCAIGNSAGSVEPLEDTELGFAINQCFVLIHYLSSSTPEDREVFNNKVTRILSNIKNFVHLHYIGSKDFKLKTPDGLNKQLTMWKNRLPIVEDFAERYLLFDAEHFIRALYGLKLFNKERIKKEYNEINFLIREVAKIEWEKYAGTFKYKGLPHKKYLSYHYFYKDII